MSRHVTAVIAVLCLSASPLRAQTVFTVQTAAADIYKSPSTGSPIIGHASRGAVLEVTRELGSWVRVAWSAAADGVGYVHVSSGSIAHRAPGAPARAAEPVTPPAASPPVVQPASASTTAAPARRSEPTTAAPGTVRIRPPAHTLGFGGRVGAPNLALGATARAWSPARFGIQIDLSRYGFDAPEQQTAMQLAGSALYAWQGRVSDDWWLRPYVGAGPSLQHRGDAGIGSPGDPVSGTRFGFQAFGGGELTLAGLPNVAVSVDLGYQWLQSPFASGDPSGVRVNVLGHWYIK